MASYKQSEKSLITLSNFLLFNSLCKSDNRNEFEVHKRQNKLKFIATGRIDSATTWLTSKPQIPNSHVLNISKQKPVTIM